LDDAVETDLVPRHRIWIGAVFLQRDSPQERTLVTRSGSAYFNANELDFTTGGGPDIYGWSRGKVFDYDFRYFFAVGMSAATEFTPLMWPPLRIDVGLPINVNSPFLDVTSRTDLLSFEWNLRKSLGPRFTPLLGLRFLVLNDVLKNTFDNQSDGLNDITASVLADNTLFGGQLGLDANLLTTRRIQLQTALKTGVYANGASNLLRFRTYGQFDQSIGASAGETAFVCDGSLTAVLQLSRHWAARFGYQLLYLNGLALSSEQSRIGPGQVHIVTTGDMLLQGGLVSLEAGW
jgi:hypothetical protein